MRRSERKLLFHPIIDQAAVTLLFPGLTSTRCMQLLSAGWSEGPWAIPVQTSSGPMTTNGEWRKRQMDHRVHALLYTNRYSSEWDEALDLADLLHACGATDFPRGRLAAESMELLCGPCVGAQPNKGEQRAAVLFLHLSVCTSNLSDLVEVLHLLRSVTRADSDGTAAIDVASHVTRGFVKAAESQPVNVVSFVAFEEESRQVLVEDGITTWSAFDEWSFALARVHPPTSESLLRPHAPALRCEEVQAPGRMLRVDRSGLSIVTRSAPRSAHAEERRAFDSVATRTIYADTLALGLIQAVGCRTLASTVDNLIDPVRDPRSFATCAQQFRVLRNRYWWQQCSPWQYPDLVLAAYEQLNGLDALMVRLREDIQDFASGVERAQTGVLNRVLLAIAFVGLAAGGCGALLTYYAPHRVPAIAVGLVTGAVASLGLLLLVSTRWHTRRGLPRSD
jgi:hypothetical protein